MNSELIILIVQIIAALGVVISVVYLGIQIHQQNEITKAQFGHSLLKDNMKDILHHLKMESLVNFFQKIGPVIYQKKIELE